MNITEHFIDNVEISDYASIDSEKKAAINRRLSAGPVKTKIIITDNYGNTSEHENKVVILGGLTTNTKNNYKTYVADFKENKIEEGKILSKGGILEQEIIFEEDGKIHLFFEKNFGIEPHEHVVMDFFDLFNE